MAPGRTGFTKLPSLGVVFLAVPDQAVHEVARTLASLKPSPRLSFVHVSGALGLGALDGLRNHPVGSFHPLQSFPAPRDPSAFRGITVAVDASTPALMRRLRALARTIGARPKHVDDSQRALYHAAAVFASNYLIASVGEAVKALQSAGWEREEAERSLQPLVEGVVANLRKRGVAEALTGPIRRGDIDTVRRHLAALAAVPGDPPIEGVYRMLGQVALEIATEAGLDPAAAEQTRRALTRNVAATRRRGRR